MFPACFSCEKKAICLLIKTCKVAIPKYFSSFFFLGCWWYYWQGNYYKIMCHVKHNTIPSDLQFSLDKSEIHIQVELLCQIENPRNY